MRRIRHGLCPVQVAVIMLGTAAGLLFGLAAAATWGDLDPVARTIESAAGAFLGAGALTCWAVHAVRESNRRWGALIDAARQDRSLLIRTLAAVAPDHRRELAQTLPFERVPGQAGIRRLR